MYLLYLDIRMWRTAGYQALVPIRACNRPHRLAGISAGAPYQFDESEGRGLFWQHSRSTSDRAGLLLLNSTCPVDLPAHQALGGSGRWSDAGISGSAADAPEPLTTFKRNA
jgi:hypothetical protein